MKTDIKNRSRKRRLSGTVVSDKMDKTRVVEVERLLRHRTYGKVMRRNKKYYAHDEKNSTSAGDQVIIEESRPMSKLKRWRIFKVKEKK